MNCVYKEYKVKNGTRTDPNLDLLCIWQLDTVTFLENYAKLYFDAKHLKRDFGCPFFKKKKKPFLHNIRHCPNFLD